MQVKYLTKKKSGQNFKKEVTEKWKEDKHNLQEFGFDVKVSL